VNSSFRPQHRLLTKADFQSVFSSVRNPSTGCMFRSKHFIVYQKYRDGDARLGLSVPKKVIRSAPGRNRLKRCVREYFRKNRDQFRGDVVVRWMKASDAMSYETVHELFSPLKFSSRGLK